MDNQPSMKDLLRQSAKFRAEALATYEEATAELRNWVTSMINAGDISEHEAAAITGLSRSTIRAWLGK